MSAGPKYPDCVIELSGCDGNIFGVIARARVTLTRYLTSAGVMSPSDARHEANKMTNEITAQTDYHMALAVVFSWMTVD